ncbi:MAG TPA: DUF4339 domain-containing protein [Longimicrobiales bacterium]
MFDGAYFVLTPDRQQHGPLNFGTLDAWLRTGAISLDCLIWRPGDAEWAPLRRHVIDNFVPRDENARELTPLMQQLSAYLRRKGYDVGVPTDDVDAKTLSRIAAVIGFVAKFAAQQLTGQRLYGMPRASGERTSGSAVTHAVSPLLLFSDVCALRYDLLHAASGFVAFDGDSLTTAELLWRLEVCENVTAHLLEFAVAINDQKGFFMRPLVFCSATDAYERHQHVLPKMGYRPLGVKGGSFLVYTSIIDVTTGKVAFHQRRGLIAALQHAFGERAFNSEDLQKVQATPLP